MAGSTPGLDGFTPDLEGFNGVLSIRRGDGVLGEWAVGLADRTAGAPNTPETRFGLASGTKTFTALSILSLVQDGTLALDRPARQILGDDLPLIADDVTVRRHGGELLGLIDREVLEGIGRKMLQQLDRVLALDEQVDHVVRLVEQDAGVAPGALLVTPVAEFRSHNRVNIGADLRIAQHVDDIAA